MILQPRDKKLMAALVSYGVLSTQQIQKLIFQGINHTTMMKRLRLLEKSRYIRRGVTLKDQTNTWVLRSKGEDLVGKKVTGSFSNRNTIDHDVLVNDIRMKLEIFNLAKDWTPEFQMKSEVFRNYRYRNAKERLIPDGIMLEQCAQRPWVFAIEVECSRKSKKRYTRIFDEYASKSYINRVWYFVGSVKEAALIFQIAERHREFQQGRLWFSVIDKFVKDSDPEVFSVVDSKWLRLSQIIFDNYKPLSPDEDRMAPIQGVSRQGVLTEQGVVSTKSAVSQPNSLIPAPPCGGFITPDPSPPTSGGKGSGVMNPEGDGMREFSDNSELKKCG